jgi:hypothetical protein
MEKLERRGISSIPLLIIAGGMYVGYQTLFPDNISTKVYQINAPADESIITPFTKDTLTQSLRGKRAYATFPQGPTRFRDQEQPEKSIHDKLALNFLPRVAPPEEVVKNLLDQDENIKQIALQTGLTRKEIRKIKRRKKVEERKEKRERRKLARAQKRA